MERTSITLDKDRSRGMASLKAAGVQAAFCDAVSIKIPGCTLLYISGKVALDADNQLVGRGSMRRQTEQVMENIKAALVAAGGTMDDVVRVRVYVTEHSPELLKEIHEVRSRYFSPGKLPASTLVRVSELVREGALIEIDADAVLPG
jgi:enamine deaminase RidA (YjgF/YER057c/UK114 family)